MLKNAWYPALIAGQLGATPVERTICEAPIVFFRSQSGVAAGDSRLLRAPPRAAGARHRPRRHAALRVSRRLLQRARPLRRHSDASAHSGDDAHPGVSVDRALWIHLGLAGDARRADAAAMPDLPWRENAAWDGDVMSYRHIAAAAELARDNLLDLTHIPFIHAATIGYPPELLRNDPLTFEQDGTTLRSTRVFDGVVPSANHAKWHDFRGTVKRTSASE